MTDGTGDERQIRESAPVRLTGCVGIAAWTARSAFIQLPSSGYVGEIAARARPVREGLLGGRER